MNGDTVTQRLRVLIARALASALYRGKRLLVALREMFQLKPSVLIPENAWKASWYNEDPEARLITCIEINGVPMHLDAYAVTERPDAPDEQHVICDDVDQGLGLIVGDGGWPLSTHVIHGREYVLIATPFGD